MKKIFLAKRNRLLLGRNFSWGLWALVFSLVMVGIRLLVPNFFLHSVAPITDVASTLDTKTHAFFKSFSNASASAARAEQLASQNAVLASENQALAQKVADLTALVGTSGQTSGSSILAGVVTRPPESPYDTLVLAAGSAKNVVLGMEAFAEGGVPIGTVSSVTQDFSRVTLFSAPGVSTDGWVGVGHTPLTMNGTGAGTMHAAVARDAHVVVGDVVFVPGPGMLPLGTIAQVDSDPLSPSVQLRIVPAVNLFSITWVALRTTGNVPMSFSTTTAL